MKRALREAGEPKTKVGHGGTLDPLASGVLPIALGEATKLPAGCSTRPRSTNSPSASARKPTRSMAKGKWSRPATSGRPASRSRPSAALHRRDRAGAARLFGAEDRGKAAYDRARAGEEVELKSRRVTVHELKPSSPRKRGPARRTAGFPLAGMTKSTFSRPRLQGHLHPLPRPRHRPCVGHRRPRHHVEADAAGPFGLDTGHFAGLSGEAAKARALMRTVLAAGQRRWTTSRPSPSPPTRHSCSAWAAPCPGSPHSRGFIWRQRADTPVALVEASADGLKVVRGFNL